MDDQVRRAQVVYVGETHDNPASHRIEEEVLAVLNEHNPGKVALAMEMFTPAQQPILDRWSAGELSEKQFLKQVNWYGNWSMNFAFYRPLLQYCKEHNIPVLGLNAEQELKKQVARTPFTDLPAEQRAELPDMTDDPYQQAMVASVYSGHDMGQAMRDGFQRVQTLWDETMAQSVADYLKQQNADHQVLVIAGGNHVRYGFGIPRRVFRRIPTSYLLIGSTELNVPESKQDRLMDIVKPDYPMPPYHFMLFTAYEDLPVSGVKLGIMLEKTEGGLLVKGVMPASAAEEFGLATGDLLTEVDGIRLEDNFDLIYELQQKTIGDRVRLTILRNGEQSVKMIEFSESNQQPHHGMR